MQNWYVIMVKQFDINNEFHGIKIRADFMLHSSFLFKETVWETETNHFLCETDVDIPQVECNIQFCLVLIMAYHIQKDWDFGFVHHPVFKNPKT